VMGLYASLKRDFGRYSRKRQPQNNRFAAFLNV
jgi:hypothetical protein